LNDAWRWRLVNSQRFAFLKWGKIAKIRAQTCCAVVPIFKTRGGFGGKGFFAPSRRSEVLSLRTRDDLPWSLGDIGSLVSGIAHRETRLLIQMIALVEPDGIEPTTSSMPLKRSPN